MRRCFLGRVIAALALTMLVIAPVNGNAALNQNALDVTCDVNPITEADLDAKVKRGTIELESARSDLSTRLPDSPASSAIVDAVSRDMSTLWACDGDIPRVLNFVSERVLAENEQPYRTALHASLSGQPTSPSQKELGFKFFGVTYVRQLNDGSVSLVMLYDDPATEALVDPVNWILIYQNEHWVFDYLPSMEEVGQTLETQILPTETPWPFIVSRTRPS